MKNMNIRKFNLNSFLKKDTPSKNKICVFSLTYNRPEYIKRSFESLYKRAGSSFDLYVFDDCSDEKTVKLLKTLQKKYDFKLFLNKERQYIYKNFYKNLKEIPLDYEYYIKFDSDVEILSDNLFPLMIENFNYSNEINGLTIRVEGIRNIDKYDAVIDFFNGHAIKYDAPIIYGCCMMITNTVFNSIERHTERELKELNEKWAIDTIIYDTVLKIGKFLIIEDLSVYHIDNTYGQRRKYPEYFTERKRWNKIDNDEVWYMNVSKMLYPKFIARVMYERLKKESIDFEEFCRKCKASLNRKAFEEIPKKIEKQETPTTKEKYIINMMYKVTSPSNFRPDPNIRHGSFKYFSELPEWTKNNPRLVIELEKIKTASSNLGQREENNEITIKKEKKIHKCRYCEYSNTSLKRLKTHYLMKHPEKGRLKKGLKK